MSVMKALVPSRSAPGPFFGNTAALLGCGPQAPKTALQSALPPALQAKFEKHKREADSKAADSKAGDAEEPGPAQAEKRQRTPPERSRAHNRSSSTSRPRALRQGSVSLEDLNDERLLRLQLPEPRNSRTTTAARNSSLSPRRPAPGRPPGRNLRSQDDFALARQDAGKRQMYDKRTLRRRNRDAFRAAVELWRQQHTAPGGRCRKAQGVHVAVRVRPIFEKELQNGEFEVVTATEDWGEVVVHNCLFHADLVRMFVHHCGFCFPRAFSSTATNDEVYAECCSPLVAHSLSGQLGTIFMFGQTGSGKTYTMSSIMEQAAREIFSSDNDRSVSVMAFEVAGKKCFDLLPRQRTELKLLDDKSGRTKIVGAEDLPVRSADECLKALRDALARRATAGHARNDESSRSHCVCVLEIAGTKGKLILVDCAGTERRQDSDQHTQERMRESAEINASLHALKECIRYRCKEQRVAAKSNQEGNEDEEQRAVHVPYRDSQLTRVLHESFTRPGSFLSCIGCAAPTAMDTEHTLSTLKTLQMLLSEGGASDAPNFEQRIDVDPKAALRAMRKGSGADDGVKGPALPQQPRGHQPSHPSQEGGRRRRQHTPSQSQPQLHPLADPSGANGGDQGPASPSNVCNPWGGGGRSLLARALAVAGARESPPPRGVAQAPDLYADRPQTPPKTSQGSPVGGQDADGRFTLAASSAAASAAAAEREEGLRQELARVQARLRAVEDQLRTTSSAAASSAAAELGDAMRRAERAEARAEELEAKNSALEALFRHEQESRRRCHNQLLDLKGQIRVFCRIRPPAPREQAEELAVSRRDVFTVEVARVHAELQGGERRERKASQFDAVFGPSSSQEEVYREVEDLVQSAADGYNVTVFAYGQTGAGKTFTMYGGSGSSRGLAPRTSDSIFQVLQRLDSQRFVFTVRAHLVELYKNDLIDLLAPTRERREVKRDARTGCSSIEGVEERVVTSPEQLNRLLEEGLERRSTAATQMNADSSRSHLFLNIAIEVHDREAKSSVCGKIRLCDLAGSERLSKSGATGEQMKEAIEINRSLTALGDVIESLTRGGGKIPVPYRNHKLTQLLSDSIGGSAKTLMFVNVSPAKSEVEETLSSLAYASRARSITNDVQRPASVQPARPNRNCSPLRPNQKSMTMEDLGDDFVRTLSGC